ncbi:MAG: transposase [Pirellulaceae bacterium]
MPTVADVLRQHGPAYLQKFGDKMPAEQRRVLAAMMACGTGQLGTVHYQCPACGRTHVRGRSCGNRHCPSCQAGKGVRWCARELQRLLPCHYFLLTFTLPQELRALARRHPREVYTAMFRAASDALKTLAADPRRLGASRLGFFAALHTWGRDLSFHPHLHLVVAGGGLDAEGNWRSTPPNFFLPCEPLSVLYRGKLRVALGTLAQQTPAAVWRKSWVVDCQAVGDGGSAVKYLAPYVFRAAISDRRIVHCDQQQVTFTYRRSGSRRKRRMTLSGEEFVRRLLQHVLPRGLTKVRHYGLLSPNSRLSLESLKWLVAAALGVLVWLACTTHTTANHRRALCCAECGEPLLLLAVLPPCPVMLVEPRSRPP